jgi:hypothetical protein
MELITIASTRFNNNTWYENIKYRDINNHQGCLYTNNTKISATTAAYSFLIVLEMNNDKNIIEGMGLICNTPRDIKRFKVYDDINRNKYSYHSNYRISRDKIKECDNDMLIFLEYILFKGTTHSKRQYGITRVSLKLLCEHNMLKELSLGNIKNKICDIFNMSYGSIINKLILRYNMKLMYDKMSNGSTSCEHIKTIRRSCIIHAL